MTFDLEAIRAEAAALTQDRGPGLVAAEERERLHRLHELVRTKVPLLCFELGGATKALEPVAAAVRETHAVLDERHHDVAGDGTLPARARRVCDALEAATSDRDALAEELERAGDELEATRTALDKLGAPSDQATGWAGNGEELYERVPTPRMAEIVGEMWKKDADDAERLQALLADTATKMADMSPAILALEPVLRPALDAIRSGEAPNYAVVDFDNRGQRWSLFLQKMAPDAVRAAEEIRAVKALRAVCGEALAFIQASEWDAVDGMGNSKCIGGCRTEPVFNDDHRLLIERHDRDCAFVALVKKLEAAR